MPSADPTGESASATAGFEDVASSMHGLDGGWLMLFLDGDTPLLYDYARDRMAVITPGLARWLLRTPVSAYGSLDRVLGPARAGS